ETAYADVLARMRKEAIEPAAPAAPAPAPAAAPDKDTASHAVGRIVGSSLNGQVPEQKTADIRAEIRAESADDLLKAIEGMGEVLTRSLAANQDTAGTTAAKRGIQLTFVNIASVPPRQVSTVTVAVRDVEA